MKIEEIHEEEMYVLVAPDGTPQPMTLCADHVTCIAVIQMLSDAKMGQPLDELYKGGFDIIAVKVSIKLL